MTTTALLNEMYLLGENGEYKYGGCGEDADGDDKPEYDCSGFVPVDMHALAFSKSRRNELFKSKNNILFIIVALLLLLVMPYGQVNKLYAEVIQPKEETVAYPSTPEGVVEDEHKKQYDRNFQGKPYYFLREAYCQSDYGIIVNSFTVKKLTQSDDKAGVIVGFDVVGTIRLGYVTEKEDDGQTLRKIKADECNDFDIFKTTGGEFDYGVIYYDLAREEGEC